jgi:hypothetical protein
VVRTAGAKRPAFVLCRGIRQICAEPILPQIIETDFRPPSAGTGPDSSDVPRPGYANIFAP